VNDQGAVALAFDLMSLVSLSGSLENNERPPPPVRDNK
jgi:hypothetical protein